MTLVKICGINDAASFDAALEADWIGFVFFPPSPRAITPAQAAALSTRHHGGPRRVGLFVKPTEEEIAATLAVVDLDVLQIYGADGGALQRHFGRPVWQAIGVASAADLPASSATAGLVIEAKPPPGANRPGGNAIRFDWAILQGWRAPSPWILAGGLTVSNVAEAIRVSGAPTVDTSSGVESSPGRKDSTLIARFIAEARRARDGKGAVLFFKKELLSSACLPVFLLGRLTSLPNRQHSQSSAPHAPARHPGTP